MAIRFVNTEPVAETPEPPEAAAVVPPRSRRRSAETEPAPDAAAPEETPDPAPRPRRRGGADRGDVEPAAAADDVAGPTPTDVAIPPDAVLPEAVAAALPGFEERPKPRRRAARPYRGFG